MLLKKPKFKLFYLFLAGTLVLGGLLLIISSKINIEKFVSWIGQSANAQTTCHLFSSPSNVPSGFGAWWDVFTNKLLIKITCTPTATITIGNEDPHYIYEKGYIWKDNKWQQVNFTGSDKVSGYPWYRDNVSLAINLSPSELEKTNYVVAYVCTWRNNSEWKCGCSDSTCANRYWQLQAFKKEGAAPPDTTPPTVSIASPTNGATVSGTITISANASDDFGIKEVEFFVGDIQASTDSTAPYQVAFDTNQVANGNQEIEAIAIDTSDNETTDQITVNVQNNSVSPPAQALPNFGIMTAFNYDAEKLGFNPTQGELGDIVKNSSTDIKNHLNLLKEANIEWVREGMPWMQIEANKGQYDFVIADRAIQEIGKKNIISLHNLDWPAKWAQRTDISATDGPNDPRTRFPKREFVADFQNFVKAVVERYDGDDNQDAPNLQKPIKYWAFSNEMEGREDPDDYAWWFRRFYTAVKEADSNAKVVLGSLVQMGGFLDSFLSSAILQDSNYPYFDILDIHIYPDVAGLSDGNDASDYLNNGNAMYQHVANIMQSHNVSKPIIITETGTASGPNSDSNGTNQAERLIKYYTYMFARGIKSIAWFFAWDSTMTQNWGILKQAGAGETPAKKDSFFAYKTMAEKLKGFTSVEKISEQTTNNFTEGTYKFSFSGKNPVFVAWSESNKTTDLSSYIPTSNALITDITGATQTKPTTQIPTSKSPIFVEEM